MLWSLANISPSCSAWSFASTLVTSGIWRKKPITNHQSRVNASAPVFLGFPKDDSFEFNLKHPDKGGFYSTGTKPDRLSFFARGERAKNSTLCTNPRKGLGFEKTNATQPDFP